MAKSSPRSVDWGNAVQVGNEVKHRLIWASSGPEKVGKNYFGLTGPGPIAIHCMDRLGLEGTVEKFPGKDIRIFKYRFSKTAENSQDDAKAVRDQFLEDLEISKRNARTVQIDESEMWEVFRFSTLGASSAAPREYDILNADVREYIHSFDDTDCNVQFIQKVKEKWDTIMTTDRNGMAKEKPRPSGRFEPTGFKELKYLVQANLRHSWTPENGFETEVVNCRQNMAIAGMTFPAMTFPQLGMAMYDDTNESDWE